MFEIRLIVRAVHIIAAAAWVGGSILYMVAIIPALRSAGPAPAVAAQIAALFRRMVNICIGVLLLNGAYLMFDRLTQTGHGWRYLVVARMKYTSGIGKLFMSYHSRYGDEQRLVE